MSAHFSISCISSCQLCLLVVLALFHLCISNQNLDDVLCMDAERQALIQFKHDLIDEAGRLASWFGEEQDCCTWAGIVCDNITGRVQGIHLRGNCGYGFYKQRLKGNLSSSLLHLQQLNHLDLSCNDFGGIQVPNFIGSLANLRYINLSLSEFGGIIPPQLGNLSELQVLCLGRYGYGSESTSMMNMKWLSSLHSLHHLDMSGVDLSKASDWLHVINTLPSLAQLHLFRCQLTQIHPYVPSLNITSISLLDLSGNNFTSFVPRWIFSITSLHTLDLSWCYFYGPILSSANFHNLTSLKVLHVGGNIFMNSSSVLEGLSSSVGSNLVSLDISSCGVSSSLLDSLHNLTSLLTLDMSSNQLNKRIPLKSLCNLCILREIDLSYNNFLNISFTHLLESFFECKSPALESLSIINSWLYGPIPYSIGRLLSLKILYLPNNRLDSNLPNSLGQLSKLESFSFSANSLTGVVTEAHFAKLVSLRYLDGSGNSLSLRPRLENWIPPFQLQHLYFDSWGLGPQFPLWLQSQRDLRVLDISSTSICSSVPESFWRSFPNLTYLDMSQNRIQGKLTLLGIPATLELLDLSYNEFGGKLPALSNVSLPTTLDLSNNFFAGSLRNFLCSNGVQETTTLNLGNNSFSGVIPDCWEKWQRLTYLNLNINNLSGEIPKTLGSIPHLQVLNMRGNKISGRLPPSLMNLSYLEILQLGRNELVGNIPAWFGTKLTFLRLLNLRSNNFDGYIPTGLCYLTDIQILDLAHNNLSGNIPQCFSDFAVLSGEKPISNESFMLTSGYDEPTIASDSLVMKGREDTYTTNLPLVLLLDLSSNNLVGDIPGDLTALQQLRSLNLSKNQLTGRIPEKIGDMKELETFDVSQNKLSGELPVSLSSLNFLSSFNVSYNNFTGRIPLSTQLQSLNESSFFGNKLCGAPLTEHCALKAPAVTTQDKKEDNGSLGTDGGLIISIVLGFVSGFWIIVAPLIVSRSWRMAYFRFLNATRHMFFH